MHPLAALARYGKTFLHNHAGERFRRNHPESAKTKPLRLAVFLLVAPLFLHAPQADAALYLLPDDAVITVKAFSFPASTGNYDADALSDTFHSQLTLALEKAGFSVFHGGEIPAALVIAPLQDIAETNDAAEETADQDAAENPAENDAEESLEETALPIRAESPRNRPTHALEGTVTLFRENVGNPTRIGESIRIRAESQIHCTYKIRDLATGNVLLADTSSGSAARIANEAQDIDAMLQTLSARAMTTTAATMAANLSGTSLPGSSNMYSREYYQDSPGKRLKQP